MKSYLINVLIFGGIFALYYAGVFDIFFRFILLLALCGTSFAQEPSLNTEKIPSKEELRQANQAFKAKKESVDKGVNHARDAFNSASKDPALNKAIADYKEKHSTETVCNDRGCTQASPTLDSSPEGRANIIAAAKEALENAQDNPNISDADKIKLQRLVNDLEEKNQAASELETEKKSLDEMSNKTTMFCGSSSGAGVDDCYYADKKGVMYPAASKECRPVEEYARIYSGCLFCPLFNQLFNAASSMTSKSAGALAVPFANLLVVGMALFIAYETLKLVSSFTQQDIRKYLNTVMPQFFKMLLTYLLLTHMTEFYNYFVNPLLMAGFDFGNAISGMGGSGAVSGSAGATLSPGIGSALTAFIANCQNNIAELIALGRFLICFSLSEGKEGVLPDFSIWFNGFIFMIMGLIILV